MNMPSKEAIQRVREARERMDQAHRGHQDSIDKSGRSHSQEQGTENTHLLRALSRSIADYFEAFEQAGEEDDPLQ
jgi:hypothetical protein